MSAINKELEVGKKSGEALAQEPPVTLQTETRAQQAGMCPTQKAERLEQLPAGVCVRVRYAPYQEPKT